MLNLMEDQRKRAVVVKNKAELFLILNVMPEAIVVRGPVAKELKSIKEIKDIEEKQKKEFLECFRKYPFTAPILTTVYTAFTGTEAFLYFLLTSMGYQNFYKLLENYKVVEEKDDEILLVKE